MAGDEIEPFEVKGNVSIIASVDPTEFGDGSIDIDGNINLNGTIGENTIGNGITLKDIKYATLKVQSAPGNPVSNEEIIYLDSSDNKVKSKDNSGIITVYQPTTTKGDILLHNGTTQIRFPVGSDGTGLVADSTTSSGVSWVSTTGQPTTTKGDILVHNGTTQIRFPVGSDGTSLVADSSNSSGINWVTPISTTTKGDILVHNGTTQIRFPVGTNGTSLVADSSTASGINWATLTNTAGDGLDIVGLELSVNVDGSSIEINSDTLRVSSSIAGTGLSGGSGTSLSVDSSQSQITSVGTLVGLTSAGAITFTDSTNSTSSVSGPVKTAGGVSVAKNIYIGGELNVSGDSVLFGDLTVMGTKFTSNTTTLSTIDNIIVVNSAPSGTSDAGISEKRYQLANDLSQGDVITGDVVEHTDTSQSTGSSTTIVLSSGSSISNDFYNKFWIHIYSGTGSGQVRKIKSYNGTSKIATIYDSADHTSDPHTPIEGLDFSTIPDNTSEYNLFSSQYIIQIWDETDKVFLIGSTRYDSSVDTYIHTDNDKIKTSTGSLILNNTQDSSSTITGSLVTVGGAGIAKNLYIGQTLDVAGIITSNSELNMSSNKIINCLEPTSDLDVANKKYVDDNKFYTRYVTSDTLFDVTAEGVLTEVEDMEITPTLAGTYKVSCNLQFKTTLRNITSQGATDLTAFVSLLQSQTTTTATFPSFATGITIDPGVYFQAAAATATGTITFDGQNDEDSIFLFKTNGAFSSAAACVFNLINDAKPDNIFILSGGAISLGAASTLSGTFVSSIGAVGLGAGSTLTGRLLTKDGAISIDGDITYPTLYNPFEMGVLYKFAIFTSIKNITHTGARTITGDVGLNNGVLVGMSTATVVGEIYEAGSSNSVFTGSICIDDVSVEISKRSREDIDSKNIFILEHILTITANQKISICVENLIGISHFYNRIMIVEQVNII
jgi:hypothetical protein